MHSVETNTAIQHNQYVVLLNTDNNKTGGFRLSYDILTIYDLDQQRTIVFGAIVSITSSISHLWHPLVATVATLISDNCEISNPTLWPVRGDISPCPDSTRHSQGGTKIIQQEEQRS